MIACRSARSHELPAVAQLRADMGVEMGSDLDALAPDWRERFCEYFETRRKEGRGEIFVALDDGEAIGMTAVALTDEWRAHCFGLRFAFVNAVYVRPSYRRRGIAFELMSQAIAWAKAQGCSRIRLRTSAEGRALYERLGFAPGREMELDL